MATPLLLLTQDYSSLIAPSLIGLYLLPSFKGLAQQFTKLSNSYAGKSHPSALVVRLVFSSSPSLLSLQLFTPADLSSNSTYQKLNRT